MLSGPVSFGAVNCCLPSKTQTISHSLMVHIYNVMMCYNALKEVAYKTQMAYIPVVVQLNTKIYTIYLSQIDEMFSIIMIRTLHQFNPLQTGNFCKKKILVAKRLYMMLETWPPIGWHHPFVIGWSKYIGIAKCPLHYWLTWPMRIPRVFQTPEAVSLHSPNGRPMPCFKAVQGDCERVNASFHGQYSVFWGHQQPWYWPGYPKIIEVQQQRA